MTQDSAQLTLFCFPYAGAGARAYLDWQNAFDKRINIHPVSLPGREVRIREALISDMPTLVLQLYTELKPHMNRPFAFFGYSMGAVIAFELARMLARKKCDAPIHLFVAARGAPQLNGEYKHLSHLPDAEFIEQVRAFNGLSDAVLNVPELMELITPILRADFALLDRYQYVDAAPLEIDINTYYGERDPTLNENWVASWQHQTVGECRHQKYPGDHFFIHDYSSQLIDSVQSELIKRISEMTVVSSA